MAAIERIENTAMTPEDVLAEAIRAKRTHDTIVLAGAVRDKILPPHVARQIARMIDELETITYFKHHYVRKTGLKRKIKKLVLEIVNEANQLETLDDWLIKGKYSE